MFTGIHLQRCLLMLIPFNISMLLCIVHLLSAPAPQLSSGSESKAIVLSFLFILSKTKKRFPLNSSLALTKSVGEHFFPLSKEKCSWSQNSCFLSSPFRCALLVSSDTRIGCPDGSARIACRQAGRLAGYPQTQPGVAASDEGFRASKCLYISPYGICFSFIFVRVNSLTCIGLQSESAAPAAGRSRENCVSVRQLAARHTGHQRWIHKRDHTTFFRLHPDPLMHFLK